MNLRAIVNMLRHVHGYRAHKNLRWTENKFGPGLNAILRKWRQNGRKIAITGQVADQYLNLSRYGESFWHDITWATLVRSLPEAYKAVKAALHGAERTRRRVELNNRVAKIEECVKKGQTGSAIRYALGPKNRGFDLSSLRIDEEEVTDQDEINRAATDHMKMWFDEKPAPFDGCLGGVGAKWRDVFAPEEDFLHRTAGSGIPQPLRSHMWKHFQKKDIDRTAMSDFSSLMAEPPSLDEWLSRVKGLPKKSAPGPSGLTYDMIQCWPVEIHRAVLDAHIELWHKGLSPGSWSRKWLVLIPKGG